MVEPDAALIEPPAVYSSERAWAYGRWKRVAEAVGFAAVVLVPTSCAALPTDAQIGAANRVEGHLPASTSAAPTTTEMTPTTTEAPATTTVYVTTEAPPVTVYPSPTEAPPTPAEPIPDPKNPQANPPQDNGGDVNHSPVGVEPNLSGVQPGICGVGGEPGGPELEGLVAPDCEAAAPVLVVGKVFPICQLLGGEIVLGNSEVHHNWIKWENQHGNTYFSPALYLQATPTTLDSCD